MKITTLAPLTLAFMWLGVAPVASAEATPAWAGTCSALTGADFSGVLDAPTQVTEAAPVELPDLPRYCEVKGYVTPTVGFLLVLPAENWNGKFLEQGCGGFCGGDLASSIRQYGKFFLYEP